MLNVNSRWSLLLNDWLTFTLRAMFSLVFRTRSKLLSALCIPPPLPPPPASLYKFLETDCFPLGRVVSWIRVRTSDNRPNCVCIGTFKSPPIMVSWSQTSAISSRGVYCQLPLTRPAVYKGGQIISVRDWYIVRQNIGVINAISCSDRDKWENWRMVGRHKLR